MMHTIIVVLVVSFMFGIGCWFLHEMRRARAWDTLSRYLPSGIVGSPKLSFACIERMHHDARAACEASDASVADSVAAILRSFTNVRDRRSATAMIRNFRDYAPSIMHFRFASMDKEYTIEFMLELLEAWHRCYCAEEIFSDVLTQNVKAAS